MRPRIHPAALALAADATLIVNVAHFHNTEDAAKLLQHAIRHGGSLFIGVGLTGREGREVARWLESSSTEAIGHLGGPGFQRLRRGR